MSVLRDPTLKRLFPAGPGRRLNVHKMFRKRPGRLRNVLCTFFLRPVSMGFVFLKPTERVNLKEDNLTLLTSRFPINCIQRT